MVPARDEPIQRVVFWGEVLNDLAVVIISMVRRPADFFASMCAIEEGSPSASPTSGATLRARVSIPRARCTGCHKCHPPGKRGDLVRTRVDRETLLLGLFT